LIDFFVDFVKFHIEHCLTLFLCLMAQGLFQFCGSTRKKRVFLKVSFEPLNLSCQLSLDVRALAACTAPFAVTEDSELAGKA